MFRIKPTDGCTQAIAANPTLKMFRIGRNAFTIDGTQTLLDTLSKKTASGLRYEVLHNGKYIRNEAVEAIEETTKSPPKSASKKK
eukprot:m.146212 g.146212  ORF g.146212 m.146212 type:complete len:85 (-) comp17763_c0_seq2:2226-2480(-)